MLKSKSWAVPVPRTISKERDHLNESRGSLHSCSTTKYCSTMTSCRRTFSLKGNRGPNLYHVWTQGWWRSSCSTPKRPATHDDFMSSICCSLKGNKIPSHIIILDQRILAFVLLDTKEAALYVASCRCSLEDDMSTVAINKHLRGNSCSENSQHEGDFGEDIRLSKNTLFQTLFVGRPVCCHD